MKANVNVEVVLLPRDLGPEHVEGRAVAVFDVLRATTSMAAALSAGVREIRIFDDLEAAARAAAEHTGPRLLCGERECLPPPGFDLGNSPGAFEGEAHGGRVMFMCTTNGTRAILAARPAAALFTAALVNAQAVAQALIDTGLPVTLLCAGTGGRVALEDVLGAGAVLNELNQAAERSGGQLRLESDVTRMAHRLFAGARHDLADALAESQGGQNVRAVGLSADIDYAARLNTLSAVGIVHPGDREASRHIQGLLIVRHQGQAARTSGDENGRE